MPPLVVRRPEHAAACFFSDDVWKISADVGNRRAPRSVVTRQEQTDVVLAVDNVSKRFSGRKGDDGVLAVDGVSLALCRGQTYALVGESGSGKSTLARLITRLIEPDEGRILLAGEDVSHGHGGALRSLRRNVQIVVQDPYSSLNPRMRIGDSIAEPLRSQGRFKEIGGARRVGELLELVGLSERLARQYPAHLSGGQRQRVGIARALATQPTVLVLDEPVSALDVSIQAQILVLLRRLQRELGVAYLFITHDLSVAQYLGDTLGVMYGGSIVETGTPSDVLGDPKHLYTRRLVQAMPKVTARAHL
jgi:ABC-type glutathione transport system ATPase component